MRAAAKRAVRTVVLAGVMTVALGHFSLVRAQGKVSPGTFQNTLALYKTITSSFPDRKTSSYAARQFLSFAAAALRAAGWTVEILPYSVVVRTETAGGNGVSLLQVSGENLLAWPPGTSFPAASLNLLLVVPYDLLFADSEGGVSFTSLMPAALLDAAVREGGSFSGTALAFVSGHYQFGAGTLALIQEMREKKGVGIQKAIVLGDPFSATGLPVVFSPDVPATFVKQVYAALSDNGLSPFLAGQSTRSGWYSSTYTDFLFASTSPETYLDNGNFRGEQVLLENAGIPAITLGTPRQLSAIRLDEVEKHLGLKISGLTAAIRDIAESAALPGQYGPETGPAGSFGLFQVYGRLLVVPKSYLVASGLGACIASIAAMIRGSRRAHVQPLVLLAGVALALAASLAAAVTVSKRGAARYAVFVQPTRFTILLAVLFGSVLLLGFCRLWRVRSRIHHLHQKYQIPEAGEPAAQSREQQMERLSATWFWNLAVSTGILIGAMFFEADAFPAALWAVLWCTVALLMEPGRPGKVPARGPFLFTSKVLHLVPFLPLVFWAGYPWSRDAQSMYLSSWLHPGPVSLAQAAGISLATFSMLRAFRFPGPLSQQQLRALTMVEVAVISLAVLTTVWSARSAPLYVDAVYTELPGPDARVILSSPRPLGRIQFSSAGTAEPSVAGATSALLGVSAVDTDGTETIRLGQMVDASRWADLTASRQRLQSAQDGQTADASFRTSVGADFNQAPTYYAIRFQAQSYARSGSQGSVTVAAENLPGFEPVKGQPGAAFTLRGGSEYWVEFVWWSPRDSSLRTSFILSSSGPLQATMSTKAVYLDKSCLGAVPEAYLAHFRRVVAIQR